MIGVVPNAFAKFQKNSINIEYRQKARRGAGSCLILPIPVNAEKYPLFSPGFSIQFGSWNSPPGPGLSLFNPLFAPHLTDV